MNSASRLEAAEEERELLEAIQQYQRSSKRMFPTWSEVLEVVLELGYRKGGETGARIEGIAR